MLQNLASKYPMSHIHSRSNKASKPTQRQVYTATAEIDFQFNLAEQNPWVYMQPLTPNKLSSF